MVIFFWYRLQVHQKAFLFALMDLGTLVSFLWSMLRLKKINLKLSPLNIYKDKAFYMSSAYFYVYLLKSIASMEVAKN